MSAVVAERGRPVRAGAGEKSAVVRRGRAVRLGDHRILAGDATRGADVRKALGRLEPKLVVTSPPYGVGKAYEKGGYRQWAALMRGWIDALRGKPNTLAINLADVRCAPGGFARHTYGDLVRICQEAGWRLLDTRIWVKPAAWAGPRTIAAR